MPRSALRLIDPFGTDWSRKSSVSGPIDEGHVVERAGRGLAGGAHRQPSRPAPGHLRFGSRVPFAGRCAGRSRPPGRQSCARRARPRAGSARNAVTAPIAAPATASAAAPSHPGPRGVPATTSRPRRTDWRARRRASFVRFEIPIGMPLMCCLRLTNRTLRAAARRTHEMGTAGERLRRVAGPSSADHRAHTDGRIYSVQPSGGGHSDVLSTRSISPSSCSRRWPSPAGRHGACARRTPSGRRWTRASTSIPSTSRGACSIGRA